MSKKGFTLIELLAVIIIVSLLTILVLPKITNAVKNFSTKTDKLMMNMIEDAAKLYMDDLNIKSNNDYCISLAELVNKGYLKERIMLNGQDITNTKSINVNFSENVNYELVDIEKCNICKLVNDADNSDSITIGDKYQCKVKEDMEEEFFDGYYFFVLSINDDKTINLIMERNIHYDSTNDVGVVATRDNISVSTLTVSVPWITKTDYTSAGGINWDDCSDMNMYGPITALNSLYKATKDWNNIPNIRMNYIDEGNVGKYGYGTIKTIDNVTKITKKDGTSLMVLTNRDGYTNLKARLPQYNELYGPEKCLKRSENESGSCPLWLVNYLSSDSNVMGEGVKNIEGINGYWTLSAVEYSASIAWYVNNGGYLVHTTVDSNSNAGIRPVITISSNLMYN